MTKQKSTKRALLMSALSLLLCMSMLVGTTFAWFTDSVTSGKNTIQSGNLDVELYYGASANGPWTEVTTSSDIFGYNLWEPGYTKVAYFKVVNAGSLALKYTLTADVYTETAGVNKDGKDFLLSDYLYTKIVAADATREDILASTDGKLLKGAIDIDNAGKLLKGEEAIVGLAIWMPTTVGNEANHNGEKVPAIDFGINLLATQEMKEEDSFGNDYDKDAKYPGQVSTVAELEDALSKGGNIQLTENIKLTSTLPAKKDAVIDLNGNTITAPSSGAMFQSSSDTDPSMIITSSTAGAEINVTGGDTSVLLGYGSTEVSNVTINVTDCDNASPNPFKVFGDLTLGEGTVVNVDYLGTALISNNGAHAIVIDGAKINVGTFKTNGTAIITLNQASTLEMKNTDIEIDNFVLSPFGGDSLVSKVDGVTIEDCTFDVTDSNGASCTFVAKDGKYRLVQK